MKRAEHLWGIMLAAICCIPFGGQFSLLLGQDIPDPARFEKAIRAFELQDAEQFPPRGAIVCIGSSSIKQWHKTIRDDLAPLTIIPRGFGGSIMNDAVFFVDRIVIPYRPRAVVIYEGDNDIAKEISAKRICDAFCVFVNKVHDELPKTRIYFLSIKPSVRRWQMWPQAKKANLLIAKQCSRDPRLTYVDLAAKMLNTKGDVRRDIFVDDNLHMNRKGYEIWRDTLGPILLKAELPFQSRRAGRDQPASQVRNFRVMLGPRFDPVLAIHRGADTLVVLHKSDFRWACPGGITTDWLHAARSDPYSPLGLSQWE